MLSSEDFQENPGTLALAVSWVVVFLAILLVQWLDATPPLPEPWWEPFRVSTVTSHRFGDMTWLEVRRDHQYWRLLTASFVHFGLIHVALNTLGLINLGRLVEPWYKTGPFLAACLAMGGVGNLIGGALRQVVGVARPWLAGVATAGHWPGPVLRFLQKGAAVPVSIHTGGGSTVLLGLLALGAVVGWRSRTRIGAYLQRQMLILLALTAVLGVAMSGLVDNYGHLGGAIVGAVIGLFDRTWVRLADWRGFRIACWVGVVAVSAACLGSAFVDDRAEADYRRGMSEIVTQGRAAETTRFALERAHAFYASAAYRSEYLRGLAFELDAWAVVLLLEKGPRIERPSKPDATQLAREIHEFGETLNVLDHLPPHPWPEPILADLARVRTLGRMALDTPPRYDQVYEFVVCWNEAEKAVKADLARLNARLVELEAARKRR